MKIAEGFDYVIMGHSHRANEEIIEKGKYINLGEWEREPCYAVFDGVETKLKKLEE
jgi:UDP-2,3-diacylglucosamine pyrophosphatase LpxH